MQLFFPVAAWPKVIQKHTEAKDIKLMKGSFHDLRHALN
jgi:hypothetical protein